MVSVSEGVVSVSNGQVLVSVSDDEVLVSVSDDEAETPSLPEAQPKPSKQAFTTLAMCSDLIATLL